MCWLVWFTVVGLVGVMRLGREGGLVSGVVGFGGYWWV
jgi:hypothetical protein